MLSSEKKQSPTPESTSLLSLPNEVLLIIIAQISRLYYPTLSLVSKKFHSLISSPDLYKSRSLPETCLYVCMKFYRDINPTWFTLCLKPDQTLTNYNSVHTTKKKSTPYVLAKVPVLNSPRVNIRGSVSVGSSIYNINGSRFYKEVSVLDCGTHTWRELGKFPVELTSLSASVVDGNVYVVGRYVDDDDDDKEENRLMVFDTKTEIWSEETVDAKEMISSSCTSVCLDGKFCVKIGLEVVGYDLKEGKWDVVGGSEMGKCMIGNGTYCVIGNVLYAVYKRVLRWYDVEVNRWRELMLVGLPGLTCLVRLVDYGGKMLVLWDEISLDGSEKTVWCAVIELKRRKDGEMWGFVDWFDHVVKLPAGYDFVKVVVTTV